MKSGADEFVLRNEFAAVAIRKNTVCNGVQLEIVDLRSGDSVLLDPLELESFARSTTQYRMKLFICALRAAQIGHDELPPLDS